MVVAVSEREKVAMKKINMVILVVGLLFSACYGDAMLRGKIVNTAGEPMAGQTVWCKSQTGFYDSDLSGDDGIYRIGLPSGVYKVSILSSSESGYAQSSESDVVVGDENVELNFTLRKVQEMGSITGRVTDDQGKAVAGVKVLASGTDRKFASDETDENGCYQLGSLEDGKYEVQIIGDGYSRNFLNKKTVDISGSAVAGVDIELLGKNKVESVLSALAEQADASILESGKPDLINDEAKDSGVLYEMLIKVDLGEQPAGPITAVTMTSLVLLNNDGFCMEMKNDKTGEITSRQYMSYARQQMVSLLDATGTYMKIDMGDNLPGKFGQNVNDPKEMFRQFEGNECIDLGEKEIDGKKVRGRQCSEIDVAGYKNAVTTVWTDVENDNPVCIEVKGEFGAGKKVDLVMNNFRWNVKVDPALFIPEIPADYKAAGPDMKMPAVDMPAAIEALKIYSEKLGEFPEDTTNYSLKYFEKASESVVKAGIPGKGEQMRADTMKVMGLLSFSTKLESEKRDMQYYGKSVKVGDGSAVLMSWRLDDGRYQVIWGDLQTAVMSKEELDGKEVK